MSEPSGPTQRANSVGSVWARKSWAGVAPKSRVMRMIGSAGSASIGGVVVPGHPFDPTLSEKGDGLVGPGSVTHQIAEVTGRDDPVLLGDVADHRL